MKNKFIALPGFCLAVLCTTTRGQVSGGTPPWGKSVLTQNMFGKMVAILADAMSLVKIFLEISNRNLRV